MIAKATLRPPVMNRLEEAYAWVLDGQKRCGFILRYDFGVLTLRIGQDCRYTPDFLVVNRDQLLELHEVKGFMRDDALVKLKAAAAMYPFIFKLVQRHKGDWEVTEIRP